MVKTQAWFLPLVTGISDSIEYGIFLEGKCQETAEVWYFNLYGFMRGGENLNTQVQGCWSFRLPTR